MKWRVSSCTLARKFERSGNMATRLLSQMNPTTSPSFPESVPGGPQAPVLAPIGLKHRGHRRARWKLLPLVICTGGVGLVSKNGKILLAPWDGDQYAQCDDISESSVRACGRCLSDSWPEVLMPVRKPAPSR